MSTGAMWGASFGTLAEFGMHVYDEVMVPRMFEPCGNLLLDELGVRPGDSVLDVGCGPGSVTRIAAVRVGEHGTVTGCDLSPAMLSAARAKPPVGGGAVIDYREGPADRLPVDDGAYDAVAAQHVLQFVPDRPAALREMHRALRPGGRVGICVWAQLDRSPPFQALADGIEEVLGGELADRYRGGPYALTDAGGLGALLDEAGFVDVDVSPHALSVQFDGGAEQIVATLAVTPLGAVIDRLAPDERRRLIGAVAARAADGPIESTLEANIALGKK